MIFFLLLLLLAICIITLAFFKKLAKQPIAPCPASSSAATGEIQDSQINDCNRIHSHYLNDNISTNKNLDETQKSELSHKNISATTIIDEVLAQKIESSPTKRIFTEKSLQTISNTEFPCNDDKQNSLIPILESVKTKEKLRGFNFRSNKSKIILETPVIVDLEETKPLKLEEASNVYEKPISMRNFNFRSSKSKIASVISPNQTLEINVLEPTSEEILLNNSISQCKTSSDAPKCLGELVLKHYNSQDVSSNKENQENKISSEITTKQVRAKGFNFKNPKLKKEIANVPPSQPLSQNSSPVKMNSESTNTSPLKSQAQVQNSISQTNKEEMSSVDLETEPEKKQDKKEDKKVRGFNFRNNNKVKQE